MLPTLGEYVASIEQAAHTLGQLNHLRPVRKADGQPYFSSGNFAVVFKMLDTQTGSHMALKCFLRDVPERKRRLRLVADYLKRYDTPSLLPLTYYENELWVDSGLTEQREFDAMLMPWVEGQTLGQYVKTHCDRADRPALRQLTDRFDTLARWLLEQPFAHGDLKPDNIMIRLDGQLVLVDYDGFFVPDLNGERATETGTPPYSHPKRTNSSFDRHIDNFSLLVLGLELHTLSDFPDWQAIYNPGDSLLIRSEDIRAFEQSIVFKTIYKQVNGISQKLLKEIQKQSSELSDIILTWHDFIDQKAHPETPDFVPYRKGTKWGVFDQNNNIIVPFIYDGMEPFREGFATVKKDNKYSLINSIGRELVPFIFEKPLTIISKEFISYKPSHYSTEKSFYFIKESNIPSEAVWPYDLAESFSEGLALIGQKVGYNQYGSAFYPTYNYGYINKYGQTTISHIYQNAKSFSEGLAAVREQDKKGFITKYGKWGFINSSGQVVIQFKYHGAKSFSNGLAVVSDSNIKYGLINKSAQLLTPYIYDGISEFLEGLALVSKTVSWNNKGYRKYNYGFINLLGKEVIPCVYEAAEPFSEWLAGVKDNGKWGFIDRLGRHIIDCIYDTVKSFSRGVAAVNKKDKWGFIDHSGQIVIPLIYDYVGSFSEAEVIDRGDSLTSFDLFVRYVDPVDYENGMRLKATKALVRVKRNNLWGFVNLLGEEKVPCIYEQAEIFSEGLAAVKVNGKWGFINHSGQEVITPYYNNVSSFLRGLAKVDNKGYINKNGTEYWDD